MEKEILIYIAVYVFMACVTTFAIVHNLELDKEEEDHAAYMFMACFIGLGWPFMFLALLAFMIVDGIEFLIRKILKK